MRVSDQLALSTVRVKCSNDDGTQSLGTSFYHEISLDGRNIPLLVTNRHVTEGFQNIEIMMTGARSARTATPAQRERMTFGNLPSIVVNHPSPEVDLCTIFLGPIVAGYPTGHFELTSFSVDTFVNAKIETEMGFAESVLVVGYPQGFWDENLNLPLFRRGITSTPAMVDYNGEPKFLIDCSIFPGSSGSPVFLYNYPTFVQDRTLQVGEQVAFLGVVSAVMIYNAAGEVVENPVPTAINHPVNARVPNNLGVVVKASKVTELLNFVRQSVAAGL